MGPIDWSKGQITNGKRMTVIQYKCYLMKITWIEKLDSFPKSGQNKKYS